MRLLLTGSNGFLGTRIAQDAVARGWGVLGLGRAARPNPASPVAGYLSHDLAYPLTEPVADGAIERSIAARLSGPVDAVVHAAALASPFAPPEDYIAANVRGTEHVAAWAERYGRREHGEPLPLVYVSSSSVVYRDADQLDLTEDAPTPPLREQVNDYSRTKLLGERVAQRYRGRSVVLRPRAIIGAGDTVLMPRILRLAERGVLPVLEPRSGPRVVVDLSDVGTVAHYVTQALAREATGTYHLTNAEPVELYPFALDLLDRLGVRARTVRVDPRLLRAVAGASERFSARFLGYREPPITRFGVSVLSRSKTFDVTRALTDLGAPAVSLARSVEEIVAEHRAGPA
ncbi:MAG: hypothetical protein BGO96_07440 [Micrococcales bacterium 73-15]|uniref:NAD-dependent epimerase/dehydratase family protein n=1 Tax=Salana multivorans TaxID=120377 RepID=UPI00095C6773|nr:sugar nucleotide-binding protein [Salana multivorans]OJX96105.1 MAG: hypothetical protein BGO96_07440 [Micrococcales bacterium 73-15]